MTSGVESKQRGGKAGRLAEVRCAWAGGPLAERMPEVDLAPAHGDLDVVAAFDLGELRLAVVAGAPEVGFLGASRVVKAPEGGLDDAD